MLVLAWARGDIQKLVRTACAFAHECGYPGADFVFFPEYEAAFPGIEAEREDFEMILKL